MGSGKARARRVSEPEGDDKATGDGARRLGASIDAIACRLDDLKKERECDQLATAAVAAINAFTDALCNSAGSKDAFNDLTEDEQHVLLFTGAWPARVTFSPLLRTRMLVADKARQLMVATSRLGQSDRADRAAVEAAGKAGIDEEAGHGFDRAKELVEQHIADLEIHNWTGDPGLAWAAELSAWRAELGALQAREREWFVLLDGAAQQQRVHFASAEEQVTHEVAVRQLPSVPDAVLGAVLEVKPDQIEGALAKPGRRRRYARKIGDRRRRAAIVARGRATVTERQRAMRETLDRWRGRK